jgi:hypothetical protein
MAHDEFVVYADSGNRLHGSPTGEVVEINIHRREDIATKECQDLHAADGRFYEIEYLWVEGGFGGGSANREILDVDYIYYIGAKADMVEREPDLYPSYTTDSDGFTVCTGGCHADCRFTG